MPDAEYMQQYRRNHPEYVRAMALRRKYGISLADYDRMRAEQDYRCAICGRKEAELPQAGRPSKDPAAPRIKLVVDHCHTGGQVRALLCGPCNVMLGQARDDVAVLAAGVEYLSRHAGEFTVPTSTETKWQPYPDDF